MQPGAVGLGERGVKHKLRRKDPNAKGSKLGGLSIDPSSDKPVQEQLRDILTANSVRVIDLFREWDDDSSGSVSKKEFRRALPCLGLKVEKADADALFDSFDAVHATVGSNSCLAVYQPPC